MAARKKKTEKTRPEDIKREPFRQKLQANLKPSEVTDRAQRAAHLVQDHDAKVETFKEQAAENKHALKRIGAELREVSEEVRSGKTWRDVACERIYNWTDGSVKDVRMDTGEAIAERAMSEAERQKSLPFDKPESSDDLDDEFGGEEKPDEPKGGEGEEPAGDDDSEDADDEDDEDGEAAE